MDSRSRLAIASFVKIVDSNGCSLLQSAGKTFPPHNHAEAFHAIPLVELKLDCELSLVHHKLDFYFLQRELKKLIGTHIKSR